MLNKRSNGLLCHLTSLPSIFGVGDLGPAAYRFVDLLNEASQTWWQVLPLSPTDGALGNSPYSSYSAFAFNTLLISPEQLVKDGFLIQEDHQAFVIDAPDRVAFDQVYAKKKELVELAFNRYQQRRFPLKAFEDFCANQSFWLDEFVLFVVLKSMLANTCWFQWPMAFRDRHSAALQTVRQDKAVEIKREKFAQYLFYDQWLALQGYCSAKSVGIIGDIPIYVNYDSVDVWLHPEFFKLDSEKKQTFVAGVPPDYFSKEGQRWGNPVYNWDKLRETGFSWWIERMRHNLALFDAVRVDHFRAFAQCWEIPVQEKTAVRGAWVDVPGMELFTILQKTFAHLPIIAEDLGIITPDVDALKEHFAFPGMRIIMFAFHNDYKKSRDLPDNYTPYSVVYTGTHDNNTVRGWFENEMTELEKKNSLEYFGHQLEAKDVNWHMISLAMGSVANICVVPLQDVLGAGQESRMNLPSTQTGNWQWRFENGVVTPEMLERLRSLTVKFNRVS